MRVNIKIDGDLMGKEDDEIIQVDAEVLDTVDDVILKATLVKTNLRINRASLYYNNRQFERDQKFMNINYIKDDIINMRAASASCACRIF